MKIKLQSKSRFLSLSLFIGVIAILITIYDIFVIFFQDVSPEIVTMIGIPMMYSFLFALTRRRINMKNPGAMTIQVISFLRYILVPTVIILNNSMSKFAKNYNYISEAVALMIFEMVSIFCIQVFYHPKAVYEMHSMIPNKSIIKWISVVAFLVLLLGNRSLIGNLNIFNGFVSVNDANTVPGIVSIIWQALCSFLFCFLIQEQYNKNAGREKVLSSLIICFIYIFIVFSGQISLSRWYTVITVIAMFCWLIKLYPQKKKIIIMCISVPALLLILFASMVKNTSFGSNGGWIESIFELLDPTVLDSYFAGPVSVNNAIGVKENMGIDLFSMPYDVLNNFPILGNFINRQNASVSCYNQYLGRGDQILPLIGQSFIWFGYMFSPLLSIFAVIMSKRADMYFEFSKGIYTYLYAFIAVWCALMLILNTTIWLAWMYARIIPVFLLFWGVTRVQKRRISVIAK